MSQYLIRKLEYYGPLTPEERQSLDAVTRLRTRRIRARDDIIQEGDRPQSISIVLDGWACRYKSLEDGRRQIVAYLLPGDICDLGASILREMDHSIGAVTATTLAEIPFEAADQLVSDHPRLMQALYRDAMTAASIQREWTVNVGQRTAFERLGHLLCELFVRMQTLGLTRGSSCDLPLTQGEIADTIGLSVVHVNRTLQELRNTGYVTVAGRELTIHRLDALERAALFNRNYLHLPRRGHLSEAGES
ncbi:Crp/Fnr family transcriptional regulator [Methylobacterium sp. ID0610]|uniref:Crp/Fnr family transcriptional regulator n=1 Tax=Methylobacterium carpenticola TaxID=3344827 RepID=UPI0036C8DCC7